MTSTTHSTDGGEPQSFRKKPVTIEAFQITNELALSHLIEKVPLPYGLQHSSADWHPENRTVSRFNVLIKTLEGTMHARLGDWVIKGVRGELYPCKPDIFEATYEPASSQPPQAPDAEVALRQRMEDARPEMQQILKEDLAPGGWFEQREIAEIAKRHERSSYSDGSLDVASSIFAGHVAHADRATLLRLLASRQPGLTERIELLEKVARRETDRSELYFNDKIDLKENLREVLKALEDLSFECFAPIAPCNRPSLATYNRAWEVLDKHRKRMGWDVVPKEPVTGQPAGETK